MRQMITFQDKRVCRPITAIFGMILSLLSCAAASQQLCDSEELHPLRSAVEARYSEWDLVTLSKLSKDDRQIWVENRNASCPGVAVGDFDRTGRPQYAVLLVSKKGRALAGQTVPVRKLLLLHVVSEADFSFQTLEEGQTALIPVVYRSPPGKYEYFKQGTDIRSSTTLKSDVIVLEVLEASSTAYVLQQGRVRKLHLSF